MKKEIASKSAFFTPRVAVGLAAIGALVAPLAFFLDSGGSASAQVAQDPSGNFVASVPVYQGTVVRITDTPLEGIGVLDPSAPLGHPRLSSRSNTSRPTGHRTLRPASPSQAEVTPTPAGAVVLLDTFTNGSASAVGTNGPRTYMGDGFTNNALPGGTTLFQIRSYTLYMYTAAAVTYTDIHARLALWNTYPGNNPVFGNLAALIDVDTGPLTTIANHVYTLDVNVATPYPFLVGGAGSQWGYAQNFFGTTVDGLANENNLSSIVTYNHTGGVYPAGQIISGQSPTYSVYLNDSGMTDFNFAASDLYTANLSHRTHRK